MRILLTLLSNDTKAFKAWFSKQIISKIFVLSGFVGVFATVVYFLFTGANYYFVSLSRLPIYGLLTANYVIKAAVLLIFCLGVGSSIATAFGLFFSHNKNYFYLMALPVKTSEVIKWQFVKIIFYNTVFLSIFLLPILLAYGLNFVKVDGLFISEIMLLIVSLALVTVSLGGMISLFMVKQIKKPNILINFSGVVIFFLVIVAVFNLVFPAKIELLTKASNQDFYPIYNSLPLINSLVPTNWLAMILFNDPVAILLTVILTGTFTIPYLLLMNKYFLREVQEMSAKALAPEFTKNNQPANIWLVHFEKYSPNTAIVLKDLAGIARTPTEAGYGIFLLLLMTFFFYLFSKISLNQEMNPIWIKNLIIFSYSGFVFFANTYLLRLVFPLMARESEAAWYLFTLPVDKVNILRSKTLLAFMIGLPLIILSIAVWWSLNFTAPFQLILTVSSFWTVLVLLITLTFLGAIHPNFSDGLNPERVSTSSMGIAALIVSTVITSVFSLSLYKYINGGISLTAVILSQLLMGIIPLGLFYMASVSAIKKYEF
jgi:hypothetical protein